MRTYRLQPIVHLRPFVDSLNADAPSHLLRGPSEDSLIAMLSSRHGTTGIPNLHLAARIAMEHLASRAYLVNDRFVGTHLGAPFLKHMRHAGTPDVRASFQAWFEVWRFLRTQYPKLDGRIGRCVFCARFFYRYHRKDEFCSPMCRIGPRLVKKLPQRWKAEARNRVLTAANKVSGFEASHDKNVGAIARGYAYLFLAPMLAGKVESLRSLAKVTDTHAFLSAWQFLFSEQARDMTNRLGLCPMCNQLFYRYHRTKHQTCSRKCQMIRYRRARRRGSPRSRHSRI